MVQLTFLDDGGPVKRCSRCKQLKPLENFDQYRTQANRLKRCSQCKTCRVQGKKKSRIKLRQSSEYKKHRARERSRWLRDNYSLTLAEYNALLSKQGNGCAICGQPEAHVHPRYKTPYSLAVDHDHANGRIRGLLCYRCNRGIGIFQDRPELLEKAAVYLRIR